MANGNDLSPQEESDNALLPPGQQARGRVLSMPEIYNLALRTGFSDSSARLMTAIIMQESYGRTDAYNPNDPHGGSFGLTQINGAHPGARAVMNNPELAMRMAYQLSGGGRNFSAWGGYTGGGYRKYLAQAESLAGGGRASAEGGPAIMASMQADLPPIPGPPQQVSNVSSYLPDIPPPPGGVPIPTPPPRVADVSGFLPAIPAVPTGEDRPANVSSYLPQIPAPPQQVADVSGFGPPSGAQVADVSGFLPQIPAPPQRVADVSQYGPGAAATMGGAGGPAGTAAGVGVTNPAQMPQISRSTAMFGMLAALARGYRPIQINYDPFQIYQRTVQRPVFPSNVVGRLTPDAGPPVIARTIAGGQPIQGEPSPFRRYIPNY